MYHFLLVLPTTKQQQHFNASVCNIRLNLVRTEIRVSLLAPYGRRTAIGCRHNRLCTDGEQRVGCRHNMLCITGSVETKNRVPIAGTMSSVGTGNRV
jgi:hypothetical protein